MIVNGIIPPPPKKKKKKIKKILEAFTTRRIKRY